MFRTHIYITLSNRSLAKAKRKFIYTITAEGRQGTVSGKGTVTGTANHVTLVALDEALSRYNANTEITIHAENTFVLSRIGKVSEMEASGFLKKDGTPIEDDELWARVAIALKCQKATPKTGAHEYTERHLKEMEDGRVGR